MFPSASSRLRRLRGLGPLPARTFLTPLVVVLLVTGFWWFCFRIIQSLYGPVPNQIEYESARRLGGPSFLDTGGALAVLMTAILGALLFGWLTDMRRFGWEGHRGWRLVLSLFAMLLAGLAMATTLGALILPPEEVLVANAVTDLETGGYHEMRNALRHGVDGAKEACRDLLDSDDLSKRFYGAAALWHWDGNRREMAEAACEEMRRLERLSREGVPSPLFTRPFRGRIIAGLRELRYGDALIITAAFIKQSEFWDRWKSIEEEILYKSAGRMPTN